MRKVVKVSTRRDHTITGTLLRRPFAAASCKAMSKAIDNTAVMETAVTDEAAFSAVSLAGLESASNIKRSKDLKCRDGTSRHFSFGSHCVRKNQLDSLGRRD